MIPCLYECFKHWASKGSVYIISDLHFNDSDCKLMDKDWISPEEQIAILKKAHKNDTLIVLGDIGEPSYLKQVKAYKVLIKGNHDKGSENYKEYFNEIYEGPLFISEKILLSHEPINLPFAVNVHGHDHSGSFKDEYGYNVAANVVNYQLTSLSELIKDGAIANVPSIHRIIINDATKRKKGRK